MRIIKVYGLFLLMFLCFNVTVAEKNYASTALDNRVRRFLKSKYWRTMNIPAIDGKKMYDIIIKNGYKSALDIGTSTGHSAIWIAWAMSKTGGKVITVEINKNRHRVALRNFRKAGLTKYIDARLANAHYLVPRLKGPFDFAFSDADKGWYKKYFLAVDRKMKKGGCYVSHNVSENGDFWNSKPYIRFLKSLNNYRTVFFTKGSGMSISYKIK